MSTNHPVEDLPVPDSVIPHHLLPPLRYREMPEAPHWTALVGPSVILAGLALGSGEYILWPYITVRSGFVFFWACLLGVITQFFINMEIERWTLVTGESAVTGFCRMSRSWFWVMLVCNFVPWIWPAWATGAATLCSWLAWGPVEVPRTNSIELPAHVRFEGSDPWKDRLATSERKLTWSGPMTEQERENLKSVYPSPEQQKALDALYSAVTRTGGIEYRAAHKNWFSILGLIVLGIVLTSGPVVYNTVEKIQSWLVFFIFFAGLLIGVFVIRWDAWGALFSGFRGFGNLPPAETGLDVMLLLGALAFAGAGGTMNLGQSNYIKDKGFGMGKYIGRITSPITGQEEAVSEIGYHFPHTPENLSRFGRWWRAANHEHFYSFLCTCIVCLVLLALIAYSLFYEPTGELKSHMTGHGKDMDFVWAEAKEIEGHFSAWNLGAAFKTLFLCMGISLLLTTELGVMDATSRIAADMIKINLFRNNPKISQGKIYFTWLWGQIVLSCIIIAAGTAQPMVLLKTAAALNGGVMFLYTIALLYLNTKILPRSVAITPMRFVALVWGAAFFGYFTLQAFQLEVLPILFR